MPPGKRDGGRASWAIRPPRAPPHGAARLTARRNAPAAGPGGRAPKRRRASENMRHLSGDRSWLRGSSDRPRSAGRYHKAARRRATILLPGGAARSLGDAAGGRAIDDKDEGSRPRADQLGGIGIGTRLVLEDDAHDLSLLRSAHQEEHARRVVEHRDRQ